MILNNYLHGLRKTKGSKSSGEGGFKKKREKNSRRWILNKI